MKRDAASPVETVIDRLRRHAGTRPDAPAIVAEHAVVTYGELDALVGGCAEWLASQGVERDECVGVTIVDDMTHFVVALGLASLGAAHATLASYDPDPCERGWRRASARDAS